MKNILSLLMGFFLFTQLSFSQAEDPKALQQTARSFMMTGDWNNAILVLNRALALDKNSLDLQKDMIQCYFFKRDYEKAIIGVKNIIDREDADVVTYQLAGNVYKALEDVKETDKVYKKGLKKFPKSGPLYSEYGEFLWARKDFAAIDYWEKGIEMDPGFSGNYYNAALYYFYTKDKVWNLIYGEIFVNMESLSERGTAMKELLLKGYKEKLFAQPNLLSGEENNKSVFAKSFLETMTKQTSLLTKGITTASLTMIRTRFILDWYETNSSRFPFRLFDYHQQLLREGLFNAYNQWLFGTIEDLKTFEVWTKSHTEEYNNFSNFQKNRIFKMPQGQYYHSK